MQLLAALPWAKRLDQIRLECLLEMAFQLGIQGLLQFKATLELVEVGKYEAAAAQMLLSRWTQQTPTRAKELAEMMRTGVAI